MSILLTKGQPYNAVYSSTDFPTLDANWTGSVSLYTAYPGTATFTKAMTRVGDTMTINLTIGEILALDSGLYLLVTTIANSILGVSISSLEYVAVQDATVFTVPMTKLYLTMAKTDATPAGKQTKTLTNTIDGTTITLGWKGLPLTVYNAVADSVSNTVIDTELVSTETNAAGYAEVYVVKGLTVKVRCPGFGKEITVDTTGLDSIDLSTYF